MTGRDDSIYICAINAALGTSVTLGDVKDVAAAGAVGLFADEGLAFTRIAHGGSASLVRSSLSAALAEGPSSDLPEALIYSTSTRWGDSTDVIAAVGLATVPVIGITRNGCANVVPALRVARSLLLSEDDIRSVAVTLADDAGDGERLMAGDLGVLSDGAASFLVTRERPPRGWAVTGLATAAEWRLENDDGADGKTSAGLAYSMKTQIRRAVRRIEASASMRLSDVDIVLMNNYIGSALSAFAEIVGLPFERLYDDNRAAVSHCFGADPMIDLASIERTGAPAGTRVIALVCGPGVWSLFALERL